MKPFSGIRFALCIAATYPLLAGSAAYALPDLPPTPYVILGSTLLDPPPLEPVPACIPVRLALQTGEFEQLLASSNYEQARASLSNYAKTIAIQAPEEQEADLSLLEAIVASRSARSRKAQLDARRDLDTVTRNEREPERLMCALIESARLSLIMRRFPELDADLSRIERILAKASPDHTLLEAARFFKAEFLYRSDDEFNAHVAYRELASSKNPRMAAAARLRLTDLSFDAGKSRSVLLEYETLLPHGEAFGARLTDWSLRAAEAALDIGDFEAAKAWFDRYNAHVQDRDVRDIVEIRLADLEALNDQPEQARKRLRRLWRRKGDLNIENLARLRQVDLGVGSHSPDERIEMLHRATSGQKRGVRIYGLAVLVHELVLQGKISEGIAAITRLAYEGADPILARHFASDLDSLLASSQAEAMDDEGCGVIVRRLGGRYGILMGSAANPTPFLVLGRCLEQRQLHDSAIAVYRSLTRVFGANLASRVALPLARASLASGDVSLARAAAKVNIQNGVGRIREWKMIAADAETALGHHDAARDIIRGLLADPDVGNLRLGLGLTLTKLIARNPNDGDVDLLVRTVRAIPESIRIEQAESFGELAMRAATALRMRGDAYQARPIYKLASLALPNGARKGEAHYWATGQPLASEDEGDEAAPTSSDPWAQLARYEAKARRTGERYRLDSLK